MGKWNKKGSLKKIPMVVAAIGIMVVLCYSNEQNWLKSGQKKFIDDQLVVLNNLIA